MTAGVWLAIIYVAGAIATRYAVNERGDNSLFAWSGDVMALAWPIVLVVVALLTMMPEKE